MQDRTGRFRRLLIVEDDEIQLRALARSVRHDLEVFTATDSAQARELAETARPDLAVIDQRLGFESGVELVAELRAKYPLLVIALISSFESISTAIVLTAKALQAGADLVEAKPITCRQIISMLEGKPAAAEGSKSLARVQSEHIERVLRESDGNISKAARALGIQRFSLRRMLRKPRDP